MSSPRPAELTPAALAEPFTRWFGVTVSGLERVGGGRNSQVYRVDTLGGRRFALKVYFRHAADNRDRLATEYGSFAFLWDRGFREIPQPLVSDPQRGWAVYQFLEADRIPPGQAGEPEVRAAADFLVRLRALSRHPDSRQLGIASEAHFSVDQVGAHVSDRFERLRAVCGETPPFAELRAFLDDDFAPLLRELIAWSRQRLQAAGSDAGAELPWELRTLSPSDFGFHNALKLPSGKVFFLDFEYFGWDDPAKMVSDFLLHPAMNLPAALKKTFVSAVLGGFSDFPGLVARVESVYPLFGLKWCLIFLNEFLPEALMRRQFAGVAPAEHSGLQLAQLAKARQMLNQIRGEYRSFPYCD